ncbi:hypothetical protein VZT92_022705 [Zoarces viviparus]|uniref:Uncharacterized protein n=1 Tax=Zoarces viviparus TaxID=48416 RepID=A0AAW1EBP4_ZOAVI
MKAALRRPRLADNQTSFGAEADSELLPTFILPIDSERAQPPGPKTNERIKMVSPDWISQTLTLEMCAPLATFVYGGMS